MTAIEHRVHAAGTSAEESADDARVALEHLYREHADRVYAVCASVLRDRAEAEDAAQQAFVSAFSALRRGSVPRDAAAWMVAIARNECWGRARQRRALPLELDLEGPSHDDPAVSVQRHGELARIFRAIEALPSLQREALLLREMRGLSYDELAVDLKLSRPSVRSLLNRARRTVRHQVQNGATLLGAQWLNVLGRLFGDASTPTVASASRTAAVGLGALALTGGAVVGPSHVSTNHRQVRAHGAPHAAAAKPPQAPSAPAVEPSQPARAVASGATRPSGDRRTDGGARDDQRGRDGGSSGDSRSEAASNAATSESTGSDDGGSASSGNGGSGLSADSGQVLGGLSGSDGGSDGGSGGSDGDGGSGS